MIQFGISFDQKTLPDGSSVPTIKSVDVLTNIDRFDIDIKIWGNWLATMASAFEVFFVGTVVDVIDSSLQTALNTTLPTVINTQIDKSEMIVHIPTIPNWMLNL